MTSFYDLYNTIVRANQEEKTKENEKEIKE